jgi:hypothetical protein
MIRGGDASHIFGVIVMKVTLVHQHIDHRFIGVIEIPAVRPTFATMYLDEDLGKPFKRLASRYQDRDLGEPCHIAPRLVEFATPTRGPEELVRARWYRNLEPHGLAFIFCNKTSASFLTLRL